MNILNLLILGYGIVWNLIDFLHTIYINTNINSSSKVGDIECFFVIIYYFRFFFLINSFLK